MNSATGKRWIALAVGATIAAGAAAMFWRASRRRSQLQVERNLERVDLWTEETVANFKIERDAAEASQDYERLAVILENLSLYYTRHAEFEDAAEALEALFEVQEKSLKSSTNPERATTLFALGQAYAQLNDPEQTIAAFKRVVLMETKMNALLHQGFQPLGAALIEVARYGEAEEVYAEALAEYERVVKVPTLELCKLLEGLAISLLEQDKEQERARELLERSLAIAVEIDGPVSVASAKAHTMLGTWKQRTDDFAGALQEFEIATPMLRELCGPEHPEIAKLLTAQARLQIKLGNMAAAESLLIECKRVLELGGSKNISEIVRTQASLDRLRLRAKDS